MLSMADNLTEKDIERIRRFQQEVKKAAEESQREMALRADYRIQIWFKSERSRDKPVDYTLSFWESGKRLHGGGDESMFICFRNNDAPKVRPFEVAALRGGANYEKKATERGCGGLIPGDMILPDTSVICPHCSARHLTEHIGDSIFYRSSITKCSEVLAHWWTELKGNADIYVKYHPTDIRYRSMLHTDGIKKAKELKGAVLYPLPNILKDMSGGKELTRAFKDLITA